MAEQVAKQQRTENGHAEATRGNLYFTPRVDIYEMDAELTLCADVPGAKPEGVDLRFENGELILHARVTPRQRRGQYVHYEYEDGDFYRVFQIHESIDASKIAAECKQGVLTVHLPKAEAAKPRQVQVRGE